MKPYAHCNTRMPRRNQRLAEPCMTRLQVKRAAMRYQRLSAQARAVQLEAISQRDKADCRGRAFAWAHCARWLDGVLRRMKK